MSDGIDLVVFEGDDWDSIYINGKLEYSGHEHLTRMILEHVKGKTVATARYGYAEPGYPMGDYLEEYGDYPPTLDEVETMGEELE